MHGPSPVAADFIVSTLQTHDPNGLSVNSAPLIASALFRIPHALRKHRGFVGLCPIVPCFVYRFRLGLTSRNSPFVLKRSIRTVVLPLYENIAHVRGTSVRRSLAPIRQRRTRVTRESPRGQCPAWRTSPATRYRCERQSCRWRFSTLWFLGWINGLDGIFDLRKRLTAGREAFLLFNHWSFVNQ